MIYLINLSLVYFNYEHHVKIQEFDDLSNIEHFQTPKLLNYLKNTKNKSIINI